MRVAIVKAFVAAKDIVPFIMLIAYFNQTFQHSHISLVKATTVLCVAHESKFCNFIFKRLESQHVGQAGLKLSVLLPQPPEF